jgi:uncharacterized protein (DUF4415 family)
MARSITRQTRKTAQGKTAQGKTASAGRSARSSQQKQADWGNVQVVWPQAKQAISLRIDQDILTWFRDRGPGYQTRMNAVLRAFVDAQPGKR